MKAIMRTLFGKKLFADPNIQTPQIGFLPPSVFVTVSDDKMYRDYAHVSSPAMGGWVYLTNDTNKPQFMPYTLEEFADGYDSPVGTVAERRSDKLWPGEWYDASPFGQLYFRATPREAYHTGADLNLPKNRDADEPIYACADGMVVFSGPLKVWGNVVVIQHEPLATTGQVMFSRYAHMNKVFVKRGGAILRGDRLGVIGNANGTLSEHLHFDLSPTFALQDRPGHWPGKRASELFNYVDPKQFIQAHRPKSEDKVQPNTIQLDENALRKVGLI